MAQITRPPDHQITRSAPGPITRSQEIMRYYAALHSRWGPQNWWPAQSRLEVIVGAYLTQNTNWANVEKAMTNLRQARRLSVKGLRDVPLRRLHQLIRPSGYFRKKAKKLKTFIRFLDEKYGGSLDRLLAQPTPQLRTELLELNGVGPETADSILLYAGNHSVFVVDAYTRRVFERHAVTSPKTDYEDIRSLVEGALTKASGTIVLQGPGSDPRHPLSPRHAESKMSGMARGELVQHYNELHALIVRAGNQYCRKKAKCDECPLRRFLPK